MSTRRGARCGARSARRPAGRLAGGNLAAGGAPAGRLPVAGVGTIIFLCAVQMVSLHPALFASGATEADSAPAAVYTSEESDRNERIPVLFLFSESGIDSDHVPVLRRSAAASLSALDPQIVLITPADRAGRTGPKNGRVVSDAEARILARDNDAVAWLSVTFVSDDGETVEVSVRLHGITAREPFLETTYTERLEEGVPNYRRIFRRAVIDVADRIEAVRAAVERAVETTRVLIRGVPDTTVLGLPGSPHTVGESGVLAVSVPSPATYAIEARAPRHRVVERSVWVTGDEAEIELGQTRLENISVDFGLEQTSFPFVEVNRALWGDYLFARIGVTTYLLGVTAFEDDPFAPWGARRTYFSSDPLSVLRVGVGSYVQRRYRDARAYVSLGFLWRQVHASGNFSGDDVAAWGLPASFGVETRPEREWRVFFEWHPTFYYTPYPEIAVEMFPGAVALQPLPDYGGEFVVDPVSSRTPVLSLGAFRIGIRRQK